MARPPDAVASAATVHCAGPPWPVRANSKSAGAAPTVIFSMAIMMTPVWVRPAVPKHAVALTRAAAAKVRLVGMKVKSLLLSIRNLLSSHSADAQQPQAIAGSNGGLLISRKFRLLHRIRQHATKRLFAGDRPVAAGNHIICTEQINRSTNQCRVKQGRVDEDMLTHHF